MSEDIEGLVGAIAVHNTRSYWLVHIVATLRQHAPSLTQLGDVPIGVVY